MTVVVGSVAAMSCWLVEAEPRTAHAQVLQTRRAVRPMGPIDPAEAPKQSAKPLKKRTEISESQALTFFAALGAKKSVAVKSCRQFWLR